MSVTLPPRESRLPFQVASFFPNRSMIECRRLIQLVEPPIGRLRYVKGNEPMLHLIVLAASCIQESSMFMPIKELFESSHGVPMLVGSK